MIAAVRSEVSVNEPVLYVAFELGKKDMEAGDDVGASACSRGVRTIAGGDLAAVERARCSGRQRFGLPASASRGELL